MPASPAGVAAAPVERTATVPPSADAPAVARPDTIDSELDDGADEETRLKFLTTGARDQDDLERDIGREADQLLTAQADARDHKRMEKTEAEIRRSQAAIAKLQVRLKVPQAESARLKIRSEIANYQQKIESLDSELDTIQARINGRHGAQEQDHEGIDPANRPLPQESRREFLIRTGKITPFSKLEGGAPGSTDLEAVMMDAEVDEFIDDQLNQAKAKGPVSHRNLMRPGFAKVDSSDSSNPSPPSTSRVSKKRRTSPAGDSVATPDSTSAREASPPESGAEYLPESDDLGASEDMPDDDDYHEEVLGRKRKSSTLNIPRKAPKARSFAADDEDEVAKIDDGNESLYQRRVAKWTKNRSAARRQAMRQQPLDTHRDQDLEEWHQPHPTEPDAEFEGGFRIPGDIYPALFDYQKTGCQWLWELYSQNVGGIIGDEMGLGKTIQAVSFVAGLHYSQMLTKPVIVIAPATVMKQWVNEFHTWWPALRVSILHTTGSGMMDTRREDQLERELEIDEYGRRVTMTKASRAAKKIVQKVQRDGHVLVTTYAGLQTYANLLIPVEWDCAILDEGHKIRNPNAAVTISCKELRTPSRIILSGTPMQNNLTELWSLFDFVFPMRLGTLVNFRNTFEFPIKRGGYASASNLEYESAMRCAETLKEAVSPYLLQRFKADVATDLPQKTERVLFCKLTRQQREAYEKFLGSEEMSSINAGKRQVLYGVDLLRKICNHPDLVHHKTLSKDSSYKYGAANKSGKMQVVKALLEMWNKGGHKTLLFAQHKIMLDILEKMVRNLPGFNYLRMDGDTPIKSRQNLVDKFNTDQELHVFLLTTKVGGLGVNLTGADRVIIYDPDWNPSTDVQARERSWRLGQKRDVEIYRLMTAATIEEKIYHRQIFKQFLSNKVLKDPKQRQTFQMSDLHDLFSLGGETTDGQTETSTIFRGSEVAFEEKVAMKAPSNSPAKGKQPANEATAQEDLAAVFGIHYAEDFNAAGDADEPANDAAGRSDERLMTTIFAKAGVHSALEHDTIMNSNASGRTRKVGPNQGRAMNEAQEIAEVAASQLRKAYEEAKRTPAGVPTWTGTHGEAGRSAPRAPRTFNRGPGARRQAAAEGGPSSGGILSNLNARRGQGRQPPSSRTSSVPNSRPSSREGSRSATPSNGVRSAQTSTYEMLRQIRDFFTTHGNVVPTRVLVQQFDRFVRSGDVSTAGFNALLRQLATMEPGSSTSNASYGRGRWVLKPEWRT